MSGEAGGDNGRRLAEGPAGDAAAAPRTGIFALNLLRRPGEEGRGGRPRALGTSVDPAWTLVVRHRAGSLDAAVGAVRLRNLAVSFGALLLVAAGVAAGFLGWLWSRARQREGWTHIALLILGPTLGMVLLSACEGIV